MTCRIESVDNTGGTIAGPRAGTRFAGMRDPDGTTIELIQPA